MSIQITPGFMRKFTEIEKEFVRPQVLDTVTDMANFAVNNSPVWSGAYVNSWSIKANNTSSSGRRRVSTKARANENAERESARAKLMGDIDKIETMETPISSITIRNDSEHAQGVEEGTPPARKAYGVATALRRWRF